MPDTKISPGSRFVFILDSTGQPANECPVFKEVALQVKIFRKLSRLDDNPRMTFLHFTGSRNRCSGRRIPELGEFHARPQIDLFEYVVQARIMFA